MVQTDRFAVQPGRAGSLQLVAQQQELALDWVLEDEGLVLVLELLAAARPSGEALPGGRPSLRPRPPAGIVGRCTAAPGVPACLRAAGD
jgi:hypothetical protein